MHIYLNDSYGKQTTLSILYLYTSTGNDLIRYSIEDSSHTFVTDITDKLEEKGLSIKKLFAVSNAEALEKRCLLPGVKQWVEKKIKDDYAMNIKVNESLLV